MTVSESQPSGERISCFLSTRKVYSGVDSQLLLTVAELSSEDTTAESSVRSTMCLTTGLAIPQLHTSRVAGLSSTFLSDILAAVLQFSAEIVTLPVIAINCPFV